MNGTLEQKSSKILKKWDTFMLFEEKSNQVNSISNELQEIIQHLILKLDSTTEENNGLKFN